MEGTIGLSAIDWCIVGAYLVGSLAVGVLVTGKATANRESYFLAGRNLPWWWAGASIAATTFAADTPLAVTGIVASRGLSGNWMWLSWLGVHAIVVVYFARRWNRAATYTDAELVALRYSGRLVEPLRLARAGLYGVVYNCIILGWVLRAMVKIVSPFFRWEAWFPSAMGTFASHWPSGSTLGTASDAVTIMALLAVVAIYSSMGGIRGVILTDLVQLALALAGSVWFAWLAWAKVGGRRGLVDGLQNQFGTNHAKLDLFPWRDAGWLDALGMGAFAFGVYLLVQSYT
ncbi:MAG: hypothetical protein KC417_12180, partial [Myxococcales bacterium]|nr:hypothetical protein [Myxococcales bacterium]